MSHPETSYGATDGAGRGSRCGRSEEDDLERLQNDCQGAISRKGDGLDLCERYHFAEEIAARCRAQVVFIC